jgi:N-hydroxyarylamine O-acetyltransferase
VREASSWFWSAAALRAASATLAFVDAVELDLEAYGRRIGRADSFRPSLETLRLLHEGHVGAIPFENLDILLGRPILLDLKALQAKLVDAQRGGYCFEQNTLFQAALERIGFRVTPLAARVRGGGIVRPRTHMALAVDVEGRRFLADVGFGGDGPIHPLPLEPGVESWTGGTGYRLHPEGEQWVLEGNVSGEWTDLYAFTLEPQLPIDFEMASYFTSTHPRSPFVQSLTAQRSWPGGRVILRNRGHLVREAGTTRETTVRDPAHLLEILERDFGLRFPPGTCFSRPEF